MLQTINIENILFLDIETVPMMAEYDQLPDNFKKHWEKKCGQLSKYDQGLTEEQKLPGKMFERAGIYAEFGKVICISTGIVKNQMLWLKSYSSDNESDLLSEFSGMLNKAGEKRIQYLCAHNGKEFDYPYLIRRMLINNIQVPAILDISGKKPWEVNHFDTMELWKFGDYKNFTSLDLLSTIFSLPSSKDDIHGSDVGRVYWIEKDLPRITTYCQKDVIAIVNLFLKFQGNPIINEHSIQIIEQ
jgi:predicted PolB exonuclease-like 3'-5' exonuclease